MSPTDQPIPIVIDSPTVTGGASPLTTACVPASGSMFPIGLTTVTCTTTDARQRAASCAFAVMVQSPPRISATRFLAFGDSITLGEDGNSTTLTSESPTPGSGGWAFPTVILLGKQYPTVLEQLLAARYTTQSIGVANGGERGEFAGASATVSRFTARLGQTQAQAALIMEGTNDISSGTTSAIDPAIAGLRSMIGIARSRGVRLYLATVPPLNPDGPRGRLGYATVPLLNTRIRALASSEGATLVDVNQAFGSNFALLSNDGLHPNADGFALIAKIFFDTIVATLDASPSSVQGLSPWSRGRR